MSNKAKYFLLITFVLIFLISNYFRKEVLAREMAAVQKSDEVITVSNPKTPAYKKGMKMRMVFEEELSIGAAEGDENYMFGSQVYLNADDEGHFYVTDWDRKAVKKYDSDGRYLKSIGGEGQGPGEFQNITKVMFDFEGNIYLNDVAQYRISFLSKEGNYLRQIKVPSSFEMVTINSKGFFIAQITDIKEEEFNQKSDRVIGLFDNKFNLVKEFIRIHEVFRGLSRRDENSIAEFFANHLSDTAFKPDVSYVLDKKDFIYLGYPENYEIKVYSPEGKLIKIIQRDYEPLKINEKQKEDFIKKHGESFMAAMPERTHYLKNKVFKLIKYPKYKPAYEQFALMENGWIFVIVNSVRGQYALVDIFDENGKYLAQFETDISTDGLFFKNGKAYALATKDDYKIVKRYRFEIQEFRDKKWVKSK